MWNPPLVDEKLGKRASALSEAAKLLAELVAREVRTICFLKSRRGVELIQRFARLRLEDMGRGEHGRADRALPRRLHARPAARDRAAPRRGRAAGGRRHRRARARHRHRRPRRGDLRDLPGHRRLACARCGAAPGRRDAGLAMYVAGEDALDQFFCRHPDEFLERPVERAILDHESEEIHLAHLAAAAYELPLTPRGRGRLRRALGAARPAAGQARPAARARRPLPAARRRLPGGRDRAALRVARLGGDRRDDGRRADRHGRGGARALRRPPGRRLPAHGRPVRGRGPRPRAVGRALVQPVRGRLVHAAEDASPRPGSSRCASGASAAASSCPSGSCR